MTQERLQELYIYDPQGWFVGKRSNKRPLGKMTWDGYRELCVIVGGKKKYIRYHRAIWLWHYGTVPQQIDHINGNPLDNRVENLRKCTTSQNQGNKGLQINSTTGFKGVTYVKSRGVFRANIETAGKSKYLGVSSDPIEAAKLYDQAARKLFGEFAHTNFDIDGNWVQRHATGRSAVRGDKPLSRVLHKDHEWLQF